MIPSAEFSSTTAIIETLQPVPSEVSLGSSIGSKLHATGGCEPCAWFWKPQGCANGADCPRCHLCPKNEVKARKKAKQAKARAQMRTQEAAIAQSHDLNEPAKVHSRGQVFTINVQQANLVSSTKDAALGAEELPIDSSMLLPKISYNANKRSKSPVAE